MKRRNLMIPWLQDAFGIFNRTRCDWSAEKPTRPDSSLQNSAANCSFCRSNATESPVLQPLTASRSDSRSYTRRKLDTRSAPPKKALRKSEKFSRSAKARPNVVFSVSVQFTAFRRTPRPSADAGPAEPPPAARQESPDEPYHRPLPHHALKPANAAPANQPQ